MAGTTINDQILSSLKSITTDKSTSNSMKADFDLQTTDWLTLLVAQLKNQDMNNTMDTSEMTNQMAQYSQIQAIQNMVSLQENMYSMSTTNYAASLIGKEVTVAEMTTTENSKGEKVEALVTKKGVVSGVTLFEGQPTVYVNEKPYALNQIMIVGDIPENPADDKPVDSGYDKPENPGETDEPESGNGSESPTE